MAGFFIDRPIFAWVIAILIMLAGSMSLVTLPVAQYPEIAPPQIGIFSTYPGASAKTVDESVTQVIEQQMKGLDHLMYMYSDSNSAGLANLYFVFEAGTNIDTAQVQVQNKLQLAMPLLPEAVQRQGISVYKSASSSLMLVSFISEDDSMSFSDISDYVASYIQDPISLISGVGETTLYGAQYAMRIWLDPERMRQYKLNPSDVIAAISDQNEQVTGGQVGAGPAVPGQQINLTVNASSRLQTVPEFENIFLRINEDGSALYLRDVARVELNDDLYLATSRFNGKPSAGLDIKLASGANALETAQAIKEKLEQLKPFFPAGLNYAFPYDTAPVVDSSIKSVYRTLGETVVLVFLVMYLFLQSFRATVIPAVTIPVVLLGTFGVLAAAGFTINTLTLFGMVLAIGLLVDDAIVVVENVERLMNEEGLSPRDAAKKSMQQITGALVGVALVISAVFVPMAFMGGSTGVIYRQFSITIVTAMSLSVIVAIVLTPAMCATMLPDKWYIPQSGFFGWFNRAFSRTTHRYEGVVARLLRRSGRLMLIYLLLAAVVGWMYLRLPTAFLPQEDQGNLLVNIQLPPGATTERTQAVVEQIEGYLLKQPEVQSMVAVMGFSFSGQGQNAGISFVTLKPWDERTGPQHAADAVAGRAMGALSRVKDAFIFPLNPPPIPELGVSAGFSFRLQDRGGRGHDALLAARNQMLGMAMQSKVLAGVRPSGLEDAPQLQVDIDRDKAAAQGVSFGAINNVISASLGSAYINDFPNAGRLQRVVVQADGPARMTPDDVLKLTVPNGKGQPVPLSAIASTRWITGAMQTVRYNGYPAMRIDGGAAPGYSSGEAMAEMERLASRLPEGFGFEWTGQSREEKLAGNQALVLYGFAILAVVLALAALYESWSIPLAVILVVPLGVLGVLLAVTGRGLLNDVYFQVGLITIIGLSAKNAILIIEFAKDLQAQGKSALESALAAAHLRFRPIVMTSLAFGLGVLPLAIASGASSASQRAIGTGVMGGIVVGTTLAVFFVPIFFVVVRSLFKPNQRELERSQQHAEHAGITAASADAYVAAAEQGMSEAERQALHQGAQPPLTKDPS